MARPRPDDQARVLILLPTIPCVTSSPLCSLAHIEGNYIQAQWVPCGFRSYAGSPDSCWCKLLMLTVPRHARQYCFAIFGQNSEPPELVGDIRYQHQPEPREAALCSAFMLRPADSSKADLSQVVDIARFFLFLCYTHVTPYCPYGN